MSLSSIVDEKNHRDIFALKIPGALSLLAHNNFTDAVRGINDIQAEYEQTYGPGNYVPPVTLSYWLFRIMVGVGFLMVAIAFYALYLVMKDKVEQSNWFLKLLVPSIFLPTLAMSTGWIFTEVARQPWIVFGLQRVEDAVSPNVSVGMLWFSLLGYIILYAALIVADMQLMVKYAKQGVEEDITPESTAAAQA